jgi:hypothetical protein
MHISAKEMLMIRSGVMHQYTLLQQELFLHQETFTISGTSDTDIPRFSIVRPTHQHDNWTGYRSSKKRQKMRKNAKKKMSIGRRLIHPKRTG